MRKRCNTSVSGFVHALINAARCFYALAVFQSTMHIFIVKAYVLAVRFFLLSIKNLRLLPEDDTPMTTMSTIGLHVLQDVIHKLATLSSTVDIVSIV